VTEPEGYESPPVASRYRAREAPEERAGSGAPSSEFWAQPPAKSPPPPFTPTPRKTERPAGSETAVEEAAGSPPLPPGGPRFVGSSPVPSPTAGRHRRRDPHEPAGGPLGAFQATWSLPAPSRARRLRPVLIPALVLVVLGVAAYVAYPHVRTWVRAQDVPVSLRSYVTGHGVEYAPVGQGYRVRLPVAPVRRDQQVTSSDGKRSMLVRRSIAAGTGYQIVIRVDEIAAGALPRSGLAGALQDPFLTGTNAPAIVHKTVIGGETAYAGEVHARNVLPFEMGVVMHRGRLFVIRIEARSVETVFGAVARSFHFTN
jgi:hypothetical protein